ncbi:MAG: AbrB/MazE/SpoVT family DNA-binding domain-containing protein [Holophagales bacterium]|nr:AbrB/MazE/SpoVT family DNA-binding domain-containing protein [Holophagales bacterium]
MRSTLTSKGQITIPAAIRRRLGLKEGDVLDFDDEAPFIKAVVVFDEKEMRSVFGCASEQLESTSEEWIEETRGPVELPSENRQA